MALSGKRKYIAVNDMKLPKSLNRAEVARRLYPDRNEKTARSRLHLQLSGALGWKEEEKEKLRAILRDIAKEIETFKP